MHVEAIICISKTTVCLSVRSVGDKYATAGERTTERAVSNTWPAFQFFSYIVMQHFLWRVCIVIRCFPPLLSG